MRYLNQQSLDRWVPGVTIVFFLVGVFAYARAHVIDVKTYLLYGYPSPLHWGLLIVICGVVVLVALASRIPAIQKIIQRARLSIAHATLWLWLCSVVGTFIVLAAQQADIFSVQVSMMVLFKITGIFIFFGAFTFINIGCGNRILKILNISADNSLQQFLLSFGIGFTATIVYFFLISIVQQANVFFCSIYFIVSVLFGREFYLHWIQLFFKKQFGFATVRKSTALLSIFFIALMSVWFSVAIMSNALPFPVGSDDQRSYYLLPKLILENHGIVHYPYYDFNNAPNAGTYLYLPLVFVSGFFLNYVNLFFLILLCALIFYCGKRWASPTAGAWAVFIFASMPWHAGFLITAKVDYLCAFFSVLSLALIFLEQKLPQQKRLALAGIFLGIAVAIKFSVLFIVPVLATILLLMSHSESIRHRVQNFSIVFGFTILGFLPWGIRSMMLGGNPLYPFFGSHMTFSPIFLQMHQMAQMFDVFYIGFVHGVSYLFPCYVNFWHMFLGTSTYPENNLGPWVFLLLPLFLYAVRNKKIRIFSLLICGTVLIWYWLAVGQVWYILYVFIIAAVCYGALLHTIDRRLQMIILIIMTAFFTLTLQTGRISAVHYLLPETTNESIFALQKSPELTDFLNTQLRSTNPSYVLLNMSDRDTRPGNILDPQQHLYLNTSPFSNQALFMKKFETQELLTALRAAGITHIYYSPQNELYWRDFFCQNPGRGFCFHGMINENFEILRPGLTEIYRAHDGSWSVYKINFND